MSLNRKVHPGSSDESANGAGVRVESPFRGPVPVPEALGLSRLPSTPARSATPQQNPSSTPTGRARMNSHGSNNPLIRSAHQPPSPSASMPQSSSFVAQRQYAEQLMHVLVDTPSTRVNEDRDDKDLWTESFRFVAGPSPRPGPAAFLYAVAMVAIAAAEVCQLEVAGTRYEQGHFALYAAYLVLAGQPLAWLVAGLQRRRVWQTPPVLLAVANTLPCISGLLRRAVWTSAPESLQYDLLKVATLHLLTALLFPVERAVRMVCLCVSSSLVLTALVMDSVISGQRPGLVLFEACSLYVVLAVATLWAWSPEHGSRLAFQSLKSAFCVQQQDVICWRERQLFDVLLCSGTELAMNQPMTSPALLRQRLARQLQEVAHKADKTYNLSRDMRTSLTEVCEILLTSIDRCTVAQDAKINVDISSSPGIVQDWLTQNFSRSISVESSLNNNLHNQEVVSSPSHVDVKKAARKYLKDKFQSGGSVVSVPVEPIPEHSQQEPKSEVQKAVEHSPEDDDLQFPNTIRAMMSALEFSSADGAPSLVSEETVGVLMVGFGAWDFNVVGISEVVCGQTLHFLAKAALEPYAERLGIPLGQTDLAPSVESVLRCLESRYQRQNPYHNGVHAADVVNSFLYYVSHFNKSGNAFSDREIFAALLSAAAHDVGHDGKSSRYHMTTESPLALLYNDQSVLEMMHCSILFAVLQSKGTTILNDWDVDSRSAFRKQVIRMILDTDLAKHFEQVKIFREKYLELDTGPGHPDDRTPEQKQDILSFLLKLSDIGGSAKPFAIHAQWATRINAEFFLQGDLEREVGLPCSPFCDRQVHKLAESQQGFYTYIVTPLYDCLSLYMNSSRIELEVMAHIRANTAFWKRYDSSRFNYKDPMSGSGDLVKLFLSSGGARVNSEADMLVTDPSLDEDQSASVGANRLRAQSSGIPKVSPTSD